MNIVYDFISHNPALIAGVFGIVNALWIGFTYFNKKRHDRSMETLKHHYRLDLEKRKKMYEMKAIQFENYFKLIDEFGKKQQVDIPRRMMPILAEFTKSYLNESDSENNTKQTETITKFSAAISSLMNEGMEQYLSLTSETSKLKLIASEELNILFEKLEDLYDSAFKLSNEFMGKFVELTVCGRQEEILKYQELMKHQGNEIKATAKYLMAQMRKELNEI